MFIVPASALRTSAPATMDPTMPLATVDLAGAVVAGERVLVEPGDPAAAQAIALALDEATVAMALSTVSTCRAIFEATVEYAKVREQYGRPIGSFQAVKHRLADCFLAVERAGALAWFAALTIAEDDPRRPLAVAMAKAAAGATERLPCARVVNLSRALETLADLGWRAVGLDGGAEATLAEALDARPTVLVMGSEGEGLRRLVAEHCDALARIPMPGGFESLNVSNAAAVALYEASRRQAG